MVELCGALFLLKIDFGISLFFTIELIYNFIRQIGKIKLYFFIKSETIIDLGTIIPTYINFISYNTTGYKVVSLTFLRIFRELRVLRVLRLYKYLKYIGNFELSSELLQYNISSQVSRSKVTKQIIHLILILISILLISAGFITILDTYIPDSFSVHNISFSEALYFIITTSTTVGYGDIVPKRVEGRMLTIVIIFVLVFILSDQMSKIVVLLSYTDKYDTSYNLRHHNIILGDLNQDRLINFLDEMYDEMTNEDEESPLTLFFSNTVIKHTIIIFNEEQQMDKIKKLEKLYTPYIHLLSTSKFSYEVVLKANIFEADNVFFLNQNLNSNYLQVDKLMSFYIRNINTILSSIRKQNKEKKCKIYIQYLFNFEKLKTLESFKSQLTFPIQHIKHSLITKCIFNKGFNTFIANLFNSPKITISTSNYYLNHYFKSTHNFISIQKFPKTLIGKNFYEASYIIYMKSVEFSKNYLAT